MVKYNVKRKFCFLLMIKSTSPTKRGGISIKRILLTLCIVMCFTGCSSLTGKSNITNLLSAPKLSENESNIVTAIENYIDEDINLKYSQNMGYSAPIQLIDIDFDSVYEAVVFYYAPNKGANIRFSLLSYTAATEEWKVVMDKEGLGTDVFYFDTIILPKVYGKQITVGYQSKNTSENFFVTYFTDKAKDIPDYVENCQYIVSGDMNGSGYSDIILTKELSNKNVTFSVLTFNDDMQFQSSKAKTLKYAGIDISKIMVSRLKDGRNAVYFDYSDGHNRMHTEIYAMEFGRLVSCIPDGIVSKSWEHEPVISSKDINGNGYAETATVIQPHYPDEVPSFKYLEWSDWTQKTPERVYYGIFDIRENIFVALPDEWQDNVYATALENGLEIKNAETDELMFSFTEKETIDEIESGAYSYAVYIGTKLWHLECSENMNMSQIEYVYKSITDFD